MKTNTSLLVRVVIVGLVLSGVFASAQETERFAIFHTYVGRPIPNVDLPKQVPAPKGELTLFADYAAADKDGVPLYLINRTDRIASFPAQDGDIYLKLEHRLSDGTWERAQSHVYSTCGNSYMGVFLGPGQHFVFRGYQPRDGEKATVRFASHGHVALTSNTGEGLVTKADVEQSYADNLGLSGVPRAITEILRPQVGGRNEPPVSLQKRVAALRLAQVFGKSLVLRRDAEKLAASLSGNPPDKDAGKTLVAIQKILTAEWPAGSNDEALFDRCIVALKAAKHGSEFGSPEDEPALVWEVLRDLAASGASPELWGSDSVKIAIQKWQALVPLLGIGIAQESEQGRRAAVAIVSQPVIADELLPNAFFEERVTAKFPEVQKISALTLSRRMEWKRLVELGSKLSPEGQILVLAALARHPQSGANELRTRDPETGEYEFWGNCMKTQPLKAAMALRMAAGYPTDYNPFNRVVHDPLHDFLLAEAQRSARQEEDYPLGKDEYEMRSAVEFLASFHMEEDVPVFKELLRFRGYEKVEFLDGTSTKPKVEHRFSVRDIAKRTLLRMNVSVP